MICPKCGNQTIKFKCEICNWAVFPNQYRMLFPIDPEMQSVAKQNAIDQKRNGQSKLKENLRVKAEQKKHNAVNSWINQVLNGRYHIRSYIGSDEFFFKYRANDLRLNKDAEVDIIDDWFKLSEEQKNRIINYSHAAAMLSHVNIQAVYDVSNHNAPLYVVRSMVDGVTLLDYLKNVDTMPWKHVIIVANEIASALNHAHSRGLYYGGFGPDKIVITKKGDVLCVDLGLLELKKEYFPQIEGELSHYTDTLQWPKQFYGSEVNLKEFMNVQNDVHSFGVILYEMIYGYCEHKDDSEFEREKQLKGTLFPLSGNHYEGEESEIRKAIIDEYNLYNDLVDALLDVIRRCITRDVNKRFVSMVEVCHEIERIKRIVAMRHESKDPGV